MTTHLLSCCLVGLAAVAATVTGCSHQPIPIYEAERQVAEYIDSGAYMRDVEAVVERARAYVRQRARGDTSRLAIVLDVDETALSNWPAYRLNNYSRILHGGCDLVDGPCGIFAYQAMGISPPLPPTVELVRDAKARGMKVFFLSGRPAKEQAATERNLRKAGYAFDDVILFPDGAEKSSSAAGFKAPVRAKLEQQGHKIILCMGDQQSDLAGGHCERTFKLPNPVYFLP